MSHTQADVVVVGAGPAGSMAARKLVHGGAKVVVLEEHRQIGSPCHCAGLVSPRTLALAGVPAEKIAMRSYQRARIWGPQGSVAWLESDRLQAIAIDRMALDRYLAQRAQESGACLWLGVRAESIEPVRGGVEITAVNGKGLEKLRTPLVIGADGVHSRVAQSFHDQAVNGLVPALKAEIQFEGAGTEDVEIFVGNEIAPGWFGWIIPLGGGQARIGLGGEGKKLKRRFAAFLELVRVRFGEFKILTQRGWMIPVRPLQRIAFDHGLLVGDAARQAKPSSGGGIYMGMRAGILAAEVALEALGKGDPEYRGLKRYEQAWLEQEGDELRYAHWLRSIYNNMNDAEIDQLVALCNRPWARLLIRRLGDIDFASQLFQPIHKALTVIAPRLLSRLIQRLHSNVADSLEDDLFALQINPALILKRRSG